MLLIENESMEIVHINILNIAIIHPQSVINNHMFYIKHDEPGSTIIPDSEESFDKDEPSIHSLSQIKHDCHHSTIMNTTKSQQLLWNDNYVLKILPSSSAACQTARAAPNNTCGWGPDDDARPICPSLLVGWWLRMVIASYLVIRWFWKIAWQMVGDWSIIVKKGWFIEVIMEVHTTNTNILPCVGCLPLNPETRFYGLDTHVIF